MTKPRTRTAAPPPRARTSKVAISLPAELLEEVERRRRNTGESRSRFVGKALERFLREADGAALVREYVEGYRRMPETAEEVEEVEAMLSESLDLEPWE